MRGLITDREQLHVDRRKALSAKGWQNMTAEERAEWLGDPFATTGVNLLSCGPYYSSVVELKYKRDAIVATTSVGGVYLYAISIIGAAANYEGKTFTLSADHIGTVDGGKPQIALYWHDDNGYEFAGASLTEAGSVTFTISENTGSRAYLAMYVYVTTDAIVEAGAVSRFCGVMLENGSVRHDYVPYAEVLATQTTKGAYNYSDLNRVERAVAEISDLFDMGLITKTDWVMWDVPTVSDMERYLNNIARIREVCSYQEGVPDLPSDMNGLTYTAANNIEKILSAAYAKSLSEYRLDDLFCGEV